MALCAVGLWVEATPNKCEDKDETFASTPSLTTLRLLLTLAVAKGWHISIGDISTAFLHALVDGDFYVIPPLEFYPEGRTLWKLKKALVWPQAQPKALAAALCICHGEERLQTHEVRPEPLRS